MPAEAWEALTAYLVAEQIHAGPLLRSRRQGEENQGITGHYLSKLVRLAMVDAGIKAFSHDGRSAHALRHTTAQDLIDAGTETRVVQKVLRHSSIQSTEIYLRGEVRHLREAMEGRRYLFPETVGGGPEVELDGRLADVELIGDGALAEPLGP